jgi:hypothetical protein
VEGERGGVFVYVFQSSCAVACRTLERFRVWGLGFRARVEWSACAVASRAWSTSIAHASKGRWEVAFDPGEPATRLDAHALKLMQTHMRTLMRTHMRTHMR